MKGGVGRKSPSRPFTTSGNKIKDCFQSGEVWKTALLGNDGIYRFLSRAVPIRDANGAVIRWFGTNTDTTELKGAEEKLVEYQQEKQK
jgi:PAS domain-containing protein